MSVDLWERVGVPLTSAQANRQGWASIKICPLCNDHKWKAGVNRNAGIFKCHKCNVTTDAVGVYARRHGVTRDAAKAELGGQAMVTVDAAAPIVHPRQLDAF